MTNVVGRIVIGALVAVMFVGVSGASTAQAAGKGQTTRVVPNPFTKSN